MNSFEKLLKNQLCLLKKSYLCQPKSSICMLNKSSIKKEILTSYPFIFALAILALNDFVLKQAFGNWITGKLSDFAGLFVFPLLLSALLPRYFKLMHWITAIGFVFWKSAYSESFIIACNSNLGLNWQRVVDYTDLIAMISVVFSYFYFQKEKFYTVKISYKPVLVMAVFFSFASMDYPPTHEVCLGDNHFIAYKINDSITLKLLIKQSNIIEDKGIHYLRIYDNKGSKIVYLKKDILIFKIDTFLVDYNDFKEYKFYNKKILIDSITKINLRYLYENAKNYENKINIGLIDSFTINFKYCLTDSFCLNFKNSQLHGYFKHINLQNNEIEIGNFKNGFKDSIFEVYQNGKLIERKFYERDFLIKRENLKDNKIEEFQNPRIIPFKRALIEYLIIQLLILFFVFLFIIGSKRESRGLMFIRVNKTLRIILTVISPIIIIYFNFLNKIDFDELFYTYSEVLLTGFATNIFLPILVLNNILWVLKIKDVINYILLFIIVFLVVQTIDLYEYIYFFINHIN